MAWGKESFPNDKASSKVPESKTIQEFSRDLEAELMKMGYVPQELEDDQEEDWL